METFTTPDKKCKLVYVPCFLTLLEEKQLMDELLAASKHWTSPTTFGKTSARKVQAYGDKPYRFANATWPTIPYTPAIQALATKVQGFVSGLLGYAVVYDSCLANYYRDGNVGIAKHSDKGREWGPRPEVATVSLGAARTFMMSSSRGTQGFNGGNKKHLIGGSLFVMMGETQERFLHSIPADPVIKQPRISLTFRRLRESYMY